MAPTSNITGAVISYMTLRQLIGWVGISMPFVVKIGGYLLDGISGYESISAYYYSGMRDVFVGTLVLIGGLLLCHRGESKIQDNWVTNLAGLAAVGIAFLPMDPHQVFSASGGVITLCLPCHRAVGFHFVAAALFFGLTSYLVYFRFPRTNQVPPTPQKLKRNWVYRICGVVMLVSIVVIGIIRSMSMTASIFVPETAAVVAFGIAWLVKGQTFFLKDPVA
jgi:hypothetical protein